MSADIGLIGLAVMGQNLVLNMADHGFVVCVFNRTVSKVAEFVDGAAVTALHAKKSQQGGNKKQLVIGASSIEEFVNSLKPPRRVMMMVQAGRPVDALIAQLVPLLAPGDVIIDGGNSEYTDSTRRCKELLTAGAAAGGGGGKKLLYVGAGISGGEEGARNGPSIMPGGNEEAWPLVRHILQGISAKSFGEPCCEWVGREGAGHFVKMVHNGIEYGDMQLICEVYQLMKDGLALDNPRMAQIFKEWNAGELESYLIEITAAILNFKDSSGGNASSGSPFLVENIRDVAGQKGTGKWTAIAALEFSSPVTLIAESVFARFLSSMKAERELASKTLPARTKAEHSKLSEAETKELLEHFSRAMYAAKLISYAQGFMMLREASAKFEWGLNMGAIALMWRGGCIIRSRFLANIKAAFQKRPNLTNLLLDEFFVDVMARCENSLRKSLVFGVERGIPLPAISSALSFFDGYRSARLPANLLQAQRDFFGSHTYERSDAPGKFVHTEWQPSS